MSKKYQKKNITHFKINVLSLHKINNKMGLKVFKECCKNCLLSKDRIVDSKRVKEITKECLENQTHFICHKATMNDDEEVLCKSFFDKFGHYSQMVRIAERLGALEFVDQPDAEKLPPFN
jgi:predicted PolB exonuclease-like 3'-5' exonuclease